MLLFVMVLLRHRYEAMAESMAKIEDHGEDPDALKDLEQHWERFMVRVPWWMRNQWLEYNVWLSWPSWAAKTTSYAVDSRNFLQIILALQSFLDSTIRHFELV